MRVPLWIWLCTVLGVVGLLALSFFTQIRKAHEPSVQEAGAWTAFFVSLSILFGGGLALVLGFIGVKLVIEAMHTNRLAFINGAEPIHLVPAIPTWLSLIIIIGILAVTTVASLIRTRGGEVPSSQ